MKAFASVAFTRSAAITRLILEDSKARADQEARRTVTITIERIASRHTQTVTSCTVALPSDDMKGRIIGREGRNIRAFEAATGINVLIDDTPQAVVLSGFDPVRREIAKQTLERLISDGRINPSRIEEEVEAVTKELDEMIRRAGDNAVFQLGLAPVHPEVVKLLGRLHYRHSFAQNVLDHSIEVGYIEGLMAVELGLDQQMAKRVGLLHDIGKSVDHEVEGAHAIIGGDLLKKYGEPVTFYMREAASEGGLTTATYYAVTPGEFPEVTNASHTPLRWLQIKAVMTSEKNKVPFIDSMTARWQTQEGTSIRAASLFHDRAYYCAVAASGELTNNMMLVFDEYGNWVKYTGLTPTAISMFNNVPYYGTAAGKIIRFFEGVTDAGTNISMDVRTKAFDFTDITKKKVIRAVTVTGLNTGATFTPYYSLDEGVTWPRGRVDHAFIAGLASLPDGIEVEARPWRGGGHIVQDAELVRVWRQQLLRRVLVPLGLANGGSSFLGRVAVGRPARRGR